MMQFRPFPALLLLALGAAPAFGERWIPSSARATGLASSFFVTDLRLLNASAADTATVQVVYYPSGGAAVTSSEFQIPPRQQRAFNNVLETLFGFTSNTSGPLRVLAPDFVQVSSRTYNVVDPCSGGTFGSAIPGVAPEAATASGVIPHVAGSADASAGSRTNVILTNPSATVTASVSVKVRGGDGTLLGQATVPPIAPRGVFQANVFSLVGAPGVTTDNAFVEFSSNAAILAIATVVDNRTNDSSVFFAAPVTAPPTLVKVGDRATFSGSYGVSGTATITSETQIQLTGFNANGTAPGMDVRVGLSSASRRDFPVLRVLGRQSFSSGTIDLTLPPGVTLNSFDLLTVWCYEFNVVIAEGRFRTP